MGQDISGISIGDRYCTLPYFYGQRGTSADTLVIDQAYVAKAPAGLTAVEATSVWMQFMTAYFPIVELAKAEVGRNILIPAGTSTSGNAALQIRRMQGATLISTTRSQVNRQTLLDNGADHVFIDDGGDIAGFLGYVTGGVGVHAAFDPVGGGFMDRYAPAMAKGGGLYLYGGLSGAYAPPPFLPMIQNSLWFHAYSPFNYVEDPVACARGKAFVYKGLSKGHFQPKVDRVFSMKGYIEAWRYLCGARTSYGKVVVETGALEDV